MEIFFFAIKFYEFFIAFWVYFIVREAFLTVNYLKNNKLSHGMFQNFYAFISCVQMSDPLVFILMQGMRFHPNSFFGCLTGMPPLLYKYDTFSYLWA